MKSNNTFVVPETYNSFTDYLKGKFELYSSLRKESKKEANIIDPLANKMPIIAERSLRKKGQDLHNFIFDIGSKFEVTLVELYLEIRGNKRLEDSVELLEVMFSQTLIWLMIYGEYSIGCTLKGFLGTGRRTPVISVIAKNNEKTRLKIPNLRERLSKIKSADFPKDKKTYLMLDSKTCEYKIGKSQDPKLRIKQIQNPHLVLIGYVDFDCEELLHNILKDACVGREYFDFYEEEAREVLLFFSKDRY